MISNRTLAIAAVLALSVPAIAAAGPIVANPVTEQLVEGHTVFAVLEVVVNETKTKANFAAAVAVLVRENAQARVASRFPGVLWFNDQYLVNPDSAGAANAMRYPCGGAVLAVNAGATDPRVSTGDTAIIFGGSGQAPGSDTLSNDQGNPASPAPYATNNSWLNTTTPYTDVLTGASGFGYLESYLITDPNDHMWQIDVYDRYSRLTIPGGTTTIRSDKVWAVNIMGAPVFRADDGKASCTPYNDIIGDVYNTLRDNASTNGICANGASPPPGCLPQGHVGFWDGTTTGPYADDPPAGYDQSGNYCYNGNSGSCGATLPTQPVRLYNALLYFKLEHLTVNGDPSRHDGTGGQTNGCQAGTEWACPVDGNGAEDDDLEGYSHPFHPATHPNGDSQPCPSGFYQDGETSNHGGSVNGDGVCDRLHATKQIDLYFNGDGRPFPPVVPNFVIQDFQGSSAPFHAPHTNHNPGP